MKDFLLGMLLFGGYSVLEVYFLARRIRKENAKSLAVDDTGKQESDGQVL